MLLVVLVEAIGLKGNAVEFPSRYSATRSGAELISFEDQSFWQAGGSET